MFWDGESEDRGTGEREQSRGGGGERVGAGTGAISTSGNRSEDTRRKAPLLHLA